MLLSLFIDTLFPFYRTKSTDLLGVHKTRGEKNPAVSRAGCELGSCHRRSRGGGRSHPGWCSAASHLFSGYVAAESLFSGCRNIQDSRELSHLTGDKIQSRRTVNPTKYQKNTQAFQLLALRQVLKTWLRAGKLVYFLKQIYSVSILNLVVQSILWLYCIGVCSSDSNHSLLHSSNC